MVNAAYRVSVTKSANNPGPAELTTTIFSHTGTAASLANVPKVQIRSALGISEPYAAFIQSGKRIPHPRHWAALVQLVGVSLGA
jgi:hypothetical protein